MTAIHAGAVETTGVVAVGVGSSSPESAEAATVRLGLGQAFSSVEQPGRRRTVRVPRPSDGRRETRSPVRNGQAGRTLNVKDSYLQDWLLSSEHNDRRVDEKLGGPPRAFADIRSQLCDLIEFVLDDPMADGAGRRSYCGTKQRSILALQFTRSSRPQSPEGIRTRSTPR